MSSELISHSKHVLTAELAASLARELEKRLGWNQTEEGAYHDRGETVWEYGCSALYSLGVYASDPTHNNQWFPEVSPDRVFDHVSALKKITREGFEDTLAVCLEIKVGYAGEIPGIDGYRSGSIFSVTDELVPIMKQLVNNEYAERIEDGFRWKEKIEPFLIWVNGHPLAYWRRIDIIPEGYCEN